MADAITFEDLGIQVSRATTDTVLGKIRSCNSLLKKEILFLVLSLGSILAVIGITIYRLTTVDTRTADYTFCIVLMLNSCFCLYYILSGVFFERPYELGVFVFATSMVWLYLVLNYAISTKGPFKMARLIIASLLSPCFIVLGILLAKNYHDSKNLIFRTVGANAGLQDICKNMFLFYSLLKGDLQISISMAVLILTSGKKLNLEDTILMPLVIVLAFVSFVLGYLSVRFEKRWMAITYAVIWICMPVYAVYLIVKSAKDLQSSADNSSMEDSIYAVTFVSAVVSLVIRAILMFVGIKVVLNFGSGLKEKVYGVEEAQRNTHVSDGSNSGENSVQENA